jgi:molecular chaperone GrpE
MNPALSGQYPAAAPAGSLDTPDGGHYPDHGAQTGGAKVKEDQKDGKGFSVIDRRVSSQEGRSVEATAEPDARKPSYLEQLERALADRDRKLAELVESHQNTMADLEGARARMRREVARDAERGRRALLVDLLEVMDNLNRALEAAEATKDFDTLLEGLRMVRDLFVVKLGGLGVSKVAALGHGFDPSLHEALTIVPVEDPSTDGMVVGVIKDGYLIGDEVLRPASVAVAKAGR